MKALKDPNDEFQQLLDLGFDHFYYGRYEAAEQAYEQARNLQPDDGRPLVLEGRSRLMQCQLDEAQAKFHEALRVDPNCVEAYEGFASLFNIYGGNHAGSIECLLYALQIRPDRHRTWGLLVRELEQLEMTEILNEAADLATRHSDGETESAFLLRCSLHRAMDNREQLLEEAERFIGRYPESKSAQLWSLMTQPESPRCEEEADHGPEIEDDEEEEFTEFLQEYADGLGIGEDDRQAIAALWQSFLAGAIPPPTLCS